MINKRNIKRNVIFRNNPAVSKNSTGKHAVIRSNKNMRISQNVRAANRTRFVPQATSITPSPLPPPLAPPLTISPKILTIDDIAERLRIESLNTNRVCIINQKDSLKDIIFCERIAHIYYEKGYKIVWPVNYALTNMNKHSGVINFINTDMLTIDYNSNKFINSTGSLIVPLRYSKELMGYKDCETMESRYALWNLPLSEWKNCSFKRDKTAEDKLFYRICVI